MEQSLPNVRIPFSEVYHGEKRTSCAYGGRDTNLFAHYEKRICNLGNCRNSNFHEVLEKTVRSRLLVYDVVRRRYK